METACVRERRIDREPPAERKHGLRASERERREGRFEEARIKHPSPPGGDVLTGRKRPPREEGGRKAGWEGGRKGGDWEGQNRMVKRREEVETESQSAPCDKK